MASPSSAQTIRLRVLISVVLIVLIFGGGISMSLFLAGLREATPLREPEPRRYHVEVFQVEQSRLQELIPAFGTARADRQVVIAAQVAGEIVEVHPRLKTGTFVQAPDVVTSGGGESLRNPGDTLVVIDPRTYVERVVQYEGRIAEARAELGVLDQEEKNLARLEAQLEQDVTDFQREHAKVEQLAARKIATDSDVRRSLIEMRTAETQLVQNQNARALLPSRREQVVRRITTLQNDLDIAKLDRARTTVRPPFDGRLAEIHVEQGQYVRPGDPLVVLSDASVVEIPLALSLDDYARLIPLVRAGKFPTAALAENETAPPRWYGQLQRVAPQADERTRSVMVYVQVDNREHDTPLLPGTFVYARIDGPLLDGALVVPRDAYLNGRGFVLKEGKAVRRDVRALRTIQTFSLIESGFEPGDQVILSNLDVLTDGALVDASIIRTLTEELAAARNPLLRRVP